MSSESLLILYSDDGCRVVPCGEDAQARPTATDELYRDVPALIDAILKLRSNKRAPSVVIALPAPMCFAASVSTAGLPARQMRQALAYRFEPLIPFSIEEMATDTSGYGESRFMVAVHVDPLKPIIRALEDAGILVAAIAPLALLAAQSVLHKDAATLDSQTPQAFKFTEQYVASGTTSCAINEITLKDGKVIGWRWQPCQQDSKHARSPALHDADSTRQHACAAALAIMAEEYAPWINLQQGPLANRQKLEQIRRPLTACLAAAVLLLLAIGISMQVRAWQYQTIAASYDQETQSHYEAAFPHETTPVSVPRRLETKLRETRGRQGLASDSQLFANQNTLAVLHDLLARLPSDLRLIITDLRIDENRIDLTGQTRSHSDADTLAQALRADDRFIVTPPSTENLSGQGVQFSLNLTPRPRNPRNSGAGDVDSLARDRLETEAARESSVRTTDETSSGGTP